MLVKSLYSSRQLLIWAIDQISVQQLLIYPVTEIRIQSQASKENKYSNDSSKNRVGKNVIYCNSYNWAISCSAITNHTPSWRHYTLMAELLNWKKTNKKVNPKFKTSEKGTDDLLDSLCGYIITICLFVSLCSLLFHKTLLNLLLFCIIPQFLIISGEGRSQLQNLTGETLQKYWWVK